MVELVFDPENPPILSVAYWKDKSKQEWRGFFWDTYNFLERYPYYGA